MKGETPVANESSIRPHHFLLLGGWVITLMVVGGAVLGVVLIGMMRFGLSVENAPIWMRLPKQLVVTAQMPGKLDVVLKGDISAEVPFKDTITAPFRGTYDADVKFAADVPVKMTISYTGFLPVNQMVELEGEISPEILRLKTYRRVKIKLKVPLKADLPFTLTVPVDQALTLAYQGPMGMTINSIVSVPLDIVLKTKIPVNERVIAPVLNPFRMALDIPDKAFAAVIRHADLRMPLRTLRLGFAGDPSRPKREDRVFPWPEELRPAAVPTPGG